VFAFLVHNSPPPGATNHQAAFRDLREESETMTLLGKGFQLRIHFVPFLPRSLGSFEERVSFLVANRSRAAPSDQAHRQGQHNNDKGGQYHGISSFFVLRALCFEISRVEDRGDGRRFAIGKSLVLAAIFLR
jgi:hypothetical protein